MRAEQKELTLEKEQKDKHKTRIFKYSYHCQFPFAQSLNHSILPVFPLPSASASLLVVTDASSLLFV